jgi:hypothetical protein
MRRNLLNRISEVYFKGSSRSQLTDNECLLCYYILIIILAIPVLHSWSYAYFSLEMETYDFCGNLHYGNMNSTSNYSTVEVTNWYCAVGKADLCTKNVKIGFRIDFMLDNYNISTKPILSPLVSLKYLQLQQRWLFNLKWLIWIVWE